MQNKPNSRKAKMNVTSILTKDYENKRFRTPPKQTQSNPTCSELVEPISNRIPYCSAERRSGQVFEQGTPMLERRRIISTRRTSRRGRGIASSCGSVDVRDEREQEDCVSA